MVGGVNGYLTASNSKADGFFDGVMQVLGAEFAKYAIEVIKNQNSNSDLSSNSNPPSATIGQSKTTTKKISVDYRTYWNSRFGFKIKYPNLLNPKGESDNFDGQIFVSNNGKAALVAYGNFVTSNLFSEQNEQLDYLSNNDKTIKVTYQVLRKNFFVVSGYQDNGNTIFYIRRHHINGCSKGFLFTYPRNERAIWDSAVEKISLTFNDKSEGAECL